MWSSTHSRRLGGSSLVEHPDFRYKSRAVVTACTGQVFAGLSHTSAL
jgi:hypothetical protein